MTRAELIKIAKPILFNTEMVKAILEGRKTVTRRICKDGNAYTVPDMGYYNADKRTYAIHSYCDKRCTYEYQMSTSERKVPICPGDILYVRETWCYHKDADKPWYGYRADGDYRDIDLKWKPSLHMPKEAARIFLKVKNVRVEQLQDITPEQAVCEGAKEQFPPLAVDEFRDIWNSTINKAEMELYGWDANPYVWVIEFERCEKNKNCK